jgi:tetratricopeptide (TPR) repeat protein
MRRLLKQISDHLQGFVDQRDDLALILCSPAADALPVLKIIEGLEDASTSDLYWVVTNNFTDPASYVQALVQGFATKHQAVRLALEQRALRPWPSIPPALLAADASPVQRLRELTAFSRELLPVPDGGTNVWVFFPLEVADGGAYATLMAGLLRHEFPFPWCHHLRFIVRDDPPNGALRRAVAGRPRIRWYQPDLSLEAVNRALEEEANDPSLPVADRVALLPVLAGTDFAWGRYAEAMKKYELLLRFHAPTGNHAMAAFALNGMGEVYEKVGDLERANQSYEAALVPASHGEHPALPVWLNTVVNLANLCVRQGRWADGEAYYDVAQQLATVARDPTTKINALDGRATCAQRQDKLDEAARSWSSGAVIAAQLQDVAACRLLLGRLEQLHAQRGEASQAAELRRQLAELGSPQA